MCTPTNPAYLSNHPSFIARHQRNQCSSQGDRRAFRTEVDRASARIDELVGSGMSPKDVVSKLGTEFKRLNLYRASQPGPHKIIAQTKFSWGRPTQVLTAKSAALLAAFVGNRPATQAC